jgi:integrase
MSRIALTDRFVKSRRRAAPGERLEFRDAIVPGLALRVTERGHKSFALIARYPLHPVNPTRRALGDYGTLTLEAAREKARAWLELIGRGIDPRLEAEREKALHRRRAANSLAAVASDFIERYAKGRLAKADEAEAVLQKEFISRWGARPITEIAPDEIAAAIRAIAKRAPYQAHNAFGYLRRLYNWAIGTAEYGVEASPLERLRPAEIIGKREARNRVLADAELRDAWGAAGALGGWLPLDKKERERRQRASGSKRALHRPRQRDSAGAYPYGPLVQLLILTGQRLREVAEMRWSEIDLEKGLWTILPARMKGGRAHEVPLAPMALAILASLPRWAGADKKGDFVFTTTAGAKPVSGFSKTKDRLDRLIAKQRAEARGADKPDEEDRLPPWVLHDLRRTMRTHLSALPVEDLVRELIIAHAKPGLHAVYDQHAYLAEKRRALELWEHRLSGILSPPPTGAGVVSIAGGRRA